jgi:nanoRNase/pAp phosphatase (c-di-AMP/oligoRNAs hydrolase)
MLAHVTERLRGREKVILVHGNADMDAIGSAYALAECFPPARIYAPGGLDRISRMVTEKLGIDVKESCDAGDHELIVVVDTSSPDQIEGDIDIPDGSLVIDHHKPTSKWSSMDLICDDARAACSEIIWDIVKDCPDIGRNVYLALLGGMITDTGHLQFANAATLRSFSEIMERGGLEMDEVLSLMKMEQSMSERSAVVKCMGRSRFERVGDMLVAVSLSGSFEASCCKGLLSAGADVAFVASQRDDVFRISSRATQEMVRRGIHLGDMLSDLGAETYTDGGGHGAAAGISGIGDAEAMLNICVKRTMDEFRRIKSGSEPV